MKPKLTKAELKVLTLRSDLTAFSDLLLHISILAVMGWLFQLAWYDGRFIDKMATWLIYSGSFVFLGHYGLGHELNHRNLFSSIEVNDRLFWVVSILTWNNAYLFQKSHETHHDKALSEAIQQSPKRKKHKLIRHFWKYIVFDYEGFIHAVRTTTLNAMGETKGSVAKKIFQSDSAEKQQVILFARAILGFHFFVFLFAIIKEAYWLIFLINLGAFGLTWPNRVLSQLHYESLFGDNQGDLLIARTLILPRWLSFLSWNMNYQIEHHWYASVPYYHLPELHKKVSEYNKQATIKGIGNCIRSLK